jgi:hypothetical protein
MTDLLLSAARRLGVPTEVSAGPGASTRSFSIWARWPRHPYEIAQDVLNQVIRTEVDASVTPVGGTPLWRARHGRWTHIGRFEDAVAHLASHVVDPTRSSDHEADSASRANPRGGRAGAGSSSLTVGRTHPDSHH